MSDQTEYSDPNTTVLALATVPDLLKQLFDRNRAVAVIYHSRPDDQNDTGENGGCHFHGSLQDVAQLVSVMHLQFLRKIPTAGARLRYLANVQQDAASRTRLIVDEHGAYLDDPQRG